MSPFQKEPRSSISKQVSQLLQKASTNLGICLKDPSKYQVTWPVNRPNFSLLKDAKQARHMRSLHIESSTLNCWGTSTREDASNHFSTICVFFFYEKRNFGKKVRSRLISYSLTAYSWYKIRQNSMLIWIGLINKITLSSHRTFKIKSVKKVKCNTKED